MIETRHHVSLRPYTTLRAGGQAETLIECRTAEDLAEGALLEQDNGASPITLGLGSNVLPSDAGVPGTILLNRSSRLCATTEGEIIADTGLGFQELVLKTAQLGLSGFEFAVGIPGTLGGALVSNAGAYRSCVSRHLTGLEIVSGGERRWVDPSWMDFSYRDSVLRNGSSSVKGVLIRAAFILPKGDRKSIYDAARDFQRQRISKQPPSPSAGSFFKNVVDRELAARLDCLPEGLKKAGIVPAGYLIEGVGLKGYRHGAAAFGRLHANFIVNLAGAAATEIRDLAEIAKDRVRNAYGVELEEEVLYLGDWSRYTSIA